MSIFRAVTALDKAIEYLSVAQEEAKDTDTLAEAKIMIARDAAKLANEALSTEQFNLLEEIRRFAERIEVLERKIQFNPAVPVPLTQVPLTTHPYVPVWTPTTGDQPPQPTRVWCQSVSDATGTSDDNAI